MTPSRDHEPLGLFIVGGSFIGLWFMITVMTRPEWLWWGLLGLGIGAGLYGSRLVDRPARNVLWTLVGLAVGALVGLAVLTPDPGLLATLITLTGGAFLAGGTPARATREALAAPAPVPEPWSHEPTVVAQTQGESAGYGQQQSVTIIRRR